MKKATILRGRKLFKHVVQSGVKVEHGLITCRYAELQPDRRYEPRVLVGFRATRKLKAVDRNMLRRLMREAMRLEYERFEASLPASMVGLGMILTIHSADSLEARRISFARVRRDLKAVLSDIQARFGDRR